MKMPPCTGTTANGTPRKRHTWCNRGGDYYGWFYTDDGLEMHRTCESCGLTEHLDRTTYKTIRYDKHETDALKDLAAMEEESE